MLEKWKQRATDRESEPEEKGDELYLSTGDIAPDCGETAGAKAEYCRNCGKKLSEGQISKGI